MKLKAPHAYLCFHTQKYLCRLSSSDKLKSNSAVTCSEKHFPWHICPWQIAIYPVTRVSVFVTFHHRAIPMINPSIRRVFSQHSVFWCLGETLWFICSDALLLRTSACSKEAQLWQSLISRRPSGGCNSLRTQTRNIFLTETEMKLGQTCTKFLFSKLRNAKKWEGN